MSAAIERQLPLLELDLLRSFAAIVDTGSFAAAAASVHRTPSAISMQIRKLEEVLGRSVFERQPRAVVLTSDGEMLLGYARQLLALNRQAVAKFVTPGLSGSVRLGTPDDFGERALPTLLRRFTETHPDIVIEVTVDHSSDLRRRHAEGQLDLTLIACRPDTLPKGAEVVNEERMVWAGARGGCAHLQRPLPVSMWEPGCAYRAGAEESLDAAGIPYRMAFRSGHFAGQKAAVRADLAIAPLPKSLVRDELRVLGPADGIPELGTCLLAMLISANPDSVVTAAADHIRATLAQIAPAREPDLRMESAAAL